MKCFKHKSDYLNRMFSLFLLFTKFGYLKIIIDDYFLLRLCYIGVHDKTLANKVIQIFLSI